MGQDLTVAENHEIGLQAVSYWYHSKTLVCYCHLGHFLKKILIEGLLVYFHKEELGKNIELSHPWASLIAQSVKNLRAMQETRVQFLDQGRSSGEGNGNALQYSCLENSMDREPGGLQSLGLESGT